jgi:hypothetical protein
MAEEAEEAEEEVVEEGRRPGGSQNRDTVRGAIPWNANTVKLWRVTDGPDDVWRSAFRAGLVGGKVAVEEVVAEGKGRVLFKKIRKDRWTAIRGNLELATRNDRWRGRKASFLSREIFAFARAAPSNFPLTASSRPLENSLSLSLSLSLTHTHTQIDDEKDRRRKREKSAVRGKQGRHTAHFSY